MTTPDTATAQQPNDVELAEEIERLLTKLAQDIKIAAQLGEYAEIAQRMPRTPRRVAPTATPLQPFVPTREDMFDTNDASYLLFARRRDECGNDHQDEEMLAYFDIYTAISFI